MLPVPTRPVSTGKSQNENCCLLRSRWTQENFFKYLRAEFGLDTLPEHALVEVEADAWVVNPACRTIGKALKQARNSVGNLRRKLALQADAGSAPARALEARIQTCDQTIQGLLLARKVTDQHILAGELSPEARLQALPQPLRLLLDTLRMLAYRAETAIDDRGCARARQSRHRPQPAQVAVSG